MLWTEQPVASGTNAAASEPALATRTLQHTSILPPLSGSRRYHGTRPEKVKGSGAPEPSLAVQRYRDTHKEIVMARARNKKAKPARKRSAKRRKAIARQSSNGWQIGAGVLALAVMLGAAIYAVSLNDGARTSVANFVERLEVPQSVKDFPDKVKQNLPEMPSLTDSSATGR
jgi:hypothetical protein